MSNFWILLKNNINITFGLPKLKQKLKKYPILSTLMPVLLVLLYLGLFVLAFLYMYLYGSVFRDVGAPEGVLLLGICIGSFLSLILTMTQSSGYLFGTKDYDLLMGMPIKHRDIIASKLAYLLMFNYLVLSYIYIPSVIIYGMFTSVGVVFYLLAFVLFLFLPLLPVAISGLISYLLGFISGKIRFKNFFTIVLFFVFLVSIMVFSMQVNDYASDEDAIRSMLNAITYMFYPGKFAFDGVTGSFLSFLGYIGASLAMYAGLIVLVAKNYAAANERAKRVYRNKKFILTEQKRSSSFYAIVKKELKMYFTKPMYVMNTMVGPILAVIMVVMFLMQPEFSLILGEGVSEGMLLMILAAIMALMGSITSTTSVAISLEGKHLWILKSSPITVKDIFISKIIVNLVITIPFILLANVAIWIFAPMTFSIYHILAIILPSVIAVLMSIGGLYINLLLPKLDWDVEVKVVKQSASVLVAMLYGFALVAIGVGVVILFASFLELIYVVGILLLVYLLLVLLVVWILEKDGTKRFLKL